MTNGDFSMKKVVIPTDKIPTDKIPTDEIPTDKVPTEEELNTTTAMENVSNATNDLVLIIDNFEIKKGVNLAIPYAVLRSVYQELTNAMLALQKLYLDVRVLFPLKNSKGRRVKFPVPLETNQSLKPYTVGQFSVVAIGGTFDRLHAGHKLMLSTAILLADQRVVVGITEEGGMMEQKQFKDIIEPWEERERHLRSFIEDFTPPHISLEIIRLTDPYGPTISTASIDALVVTQETFTGGQAST